jgi:Uma2 family endonuclease
MSQAVVTTALSVPFKLNVQATQLTAEQFVCLCQENREFRFELTAQKELVIMPPTGSETGQRNSRLTRHLDLWAEKDGTGIAFDSSTGFTLPNGAIRSPDVSWVAREQWNALTAEQRKGFAPLCPDFVVELRSPMDQLPILQQKMQEYLENGARLGWLIDPIERRVHIYCPGQSVEVLDNPTTLSGDPVLPGFVLHMNELW